MARQRRIAGAGMKDFTVTKRTAVRDRFITGEHDVELVETATESRMAGLGGQFAKGGGRVPAATGVRKWGADDQAEAEAFAQQTFEGHFGSHEFKAEVTDVLILPTTGGVRVQGVVLSNTGQPIGKFTRNFIQEQQIVGLDRIPAHVEHVHLDLDPDVQATGFSRDFNAHAEAEYAKAGYEQVTLVANIDVGGYAWARQGFKINETHQLMADISKDGLKARINQQHTGVKASQLTALVDANDMAGLAAHPGGKTVLLGSSWRGVKDLQPAASESRMAGLGGQFAKGGGRVPAQAETRKFVKGDEEDAMVMATAMYNGVHGTEGYRTEVTSVFIHDGIFGENGAEYGNVQIDGKIFDGEKEIGRFVSYIKPERPEIDGGVHREGTGFAGQDGAPAQVSHSLLELDSGRQGNGFSRDFYGQAEKEYKKAGYNQVELTANIDVGGYAWARQGYKPTPQATADLRNRITQRRSEDRYQPENHLTARDARALNRFLTRGDMNSLATYKNAKGEPTGKTFLLGSYWKGVKQI